MVVVGLSRNKDTLESVREAVELAGGLGIEEGSTVLIRPNANTADLPPGSTNPEVLKGAIREAKKCNPGKIIVAEKSMTTLDTEMVLRKLGLWQAAEAEGVDEILTFDHMKRSHVKPEGAFSWPEGFYVPEFLASVDYVIALPVIKTHWTATFTMGLKSQISITADRDRRQLPHGQHKYVLFGNMIAESNLVYKPDFYISDATKCFVTGGPDMGTLKEPGIVMACSDVIANDVVGLALLKTLGTVPKIQEHSVWAQPQIRRAVELGLGIRSREEITIKSSGIEEIEEILANLT
ncbi:Uncharacterized conserved protein, DUF362 family [Methanosarcina thermophila]|jgi:uncharacterized protein (DUF362 family)|uniref:Iron-sulfur cluster-binding protein n=3 Tax=Methanosarcina thermophila TaxID=2210 RepID=A0A1I6Y1B1_METTE|nr:DUF362 domain-containing protein [Methanosarcina thermophila]ALK05827.1 MAG: hypothetical protein AAY43_09145 [Methanosarcina sp. 795]AKB12690.1 iron-sulfur cluster-binding protein [Methanosarcina thermophila TM-1]AKB16692.1 iron-sulfur cluster-binding protein [Methanosarcina thermophila CHTI-55]NLU57691.1 DUF362 domain-containing protein [Methanosarcina thermophila]SFT44395.1 Uncharacterized conserved protein, DUF362 family [Methanosarcina thermophila]